MWVIYFYDIVCFFSLLCFQNEKSKKNNTKKEDIFSACCKCRYWQKGWRFSGVDIVYLIKWSLYNCKFKLPFSNPWISNLQTTSNKSSWQYRIVFPGIDHHFRNGNFLIYSNPLISPFPHFIPKFDVTNTIIDIFICQFNFSFFFFCSISPEGWKKCE